MGLDSWFISLWLLVSLHCVTVGRAAPRTATIDTCQQHLVTCNSTKVCINPRYLCNGDDDCGDGEDEQNCASGDLDETTATTSPSPAPQYFCEDVLEVRGGLGYISSPLFWEKRPYPAPVLCRWSITVQPGYVIALHFDSVDLGVATNDTCSDGWLEIFDGHNENSSSIGRFCGNATPTEKRSASNEVFLRMAAASNADSHMGFSLLYTAFLSDSTSTPAVEPLPAGCNGKPIVLTSPAGYITSVSFNESEVYRPQMDCEWVLLGAPGKVFYFTFHSFELEQSEACTFESLHIYDTVSDSDGLNTSSRVENTSSDAENTRDTGNPTDARNDTNTLTEIAKLCGPLLPYEVESSSNRVVLRLRTESQFGGSGFRLSYTLQDPSVKCPDGEFQCGTSECIKYSSVCDGVSDCTDGTDEVICAAATSCGRPSIQPVFSRIVGGSEVVEGSWPWTVVVVDSLTVPNKHDCGATLILPQWALTATHCFLDVSSRIYEGYFIIAGRHQVENPDRNEQIREFGAVFLRHDYEPWTDKNDLALIKLKEPFNLTDYVGLACLPQEPAPVGHLCYITGWGETLDTCCAGRLKQAGVPIINTTLCRAQGYYGSSLLEHMMCAGYPEGGVDSCGGDSGGPLVCESQSPDNHWEVQGVTSWGSSCALPNKPGVYTVVHDYVEWIQQTIARNTP